MLASRAWRLLRGANGGLTQTPPPNLPASRCVQVAARLDRMPYTVARWVKEGGWEAVDAAGDLFGVETVQDVYGRPVLLFKVRGHSLSLPCQCPQRVRPQHSR